MDVSDENMRAIYVDTNLDTNFLCLVSPNSNFVQLKDQILRDHEVFYRNFGNITINWVKVRRNQKNYHVSAENMRLRTAFHRRKTWSVLANVCRTPPNPLDMKKKKLKLKKKKKQQQKRRCGCYDTALHLHNADAIIPNTQVTQHEENLNVESVEVVKLLEMTPTFSVNHLPQLEQPDFLPTNAADNATKQKDEMSASGGLYNDLNDVLSQDVSSNLAELVSPEKLPVSEQTVKDTDLPMSAVPEFKDEYLIIPTSSNQVMNSQVPLGARKLGQNNPARKTGVLSPRNKSSTTSDDSSDNEVERSGSSCNIGTVDDASSSDSSERGSKGESKGDRSGRDENKMDLSVFKGMDVASVLRSSSQYKKSIKQAALQSQMVDDENGLVESVPDSYSD